MHPANLFKGEFLMRTFLAIFIPWFVFFTIGRPFAGIICLALQCTFIGWIPAAFWAVSSVNSYKTDKKLKKMEQKFQEQMQDKEQN